MAGHPESGEPTGLRSPVAAGRSPHLDSAARAGFDVLILLVIAAAAFAVSLGLP